MDTCTDLYTYLLVCMYICTDVYTYLLACMYMCRDLYTYLLACMYTCTDVYTYLLACMHIVSTLAGLHAAYNLYVSICISDCLPILSCLHTGWLACTHIICYCTPACMYTHICPRACLRVHTFASAH